MASLGILDKSLVFLMLHYFHLVIYKIEPRLVLYKCIIKDVSCGGIALKKHPLKFNKYFNFLRYTVVE